MEKELILVTGAAGFIGGAVARKLISLGYGIITIDNLSTGYRENIPDGVNLIEGDVYDKEEYQTSQRYKTENYKFGLITSIISSSKSHGCEVVNLILGIPVKATSSNKLLIE